MFSLQPPLSRLSPPPPLIFDGRCRFRAMLAYAAVTQRQPKLTGCRRFTIRCRFLRRCRTASAAVAFEFTPAPLLYASQKRQPRQLRYASCLQRRHTALPPAADFRCRRCCFRQLRFHAAFLRRADAAALKPLLSRHCRRPPFHCGDLRLRRCAIIFAADAPEMLLALPLSQQR
jgi:hypothetical protein